MADQANEDLLPGRATAAGTRRFAQRFEHLPGHFRRPDSLSLSSLALGSRRGRPGGIDDLLYRSAVAQCLEGGINVFDTALSDRDMTSERAIGHAVRRGFVEELAQRDEVVIVTKGGQLTLDPDALLRSHYPQHGLYATYVESGIIEPDQVVNGNCLAPRFLRDQIERSRRNLGLATLDIYLVQEPELHLRELGPSRFRRALCDVFEALECAVRDGVIGAYGLSTWSGFLVPHQEREHLSLVDVFEAALDVGGADHHLRAIQLPYGLAMGEGAGVASQLGPDGHSQAILESLYDTGTVVLASAPLYGGRLVGRIPKEIREAFPETRSDAQTCLQFVRSTKGITTAVVGMREPDHVDENIATATFPPADPSIPADLFRRFA
ncbi:MAG: aldo/keto reductase [Proteobacteria bacterium]|nr:aldo/keto reductase [Pseudomonadota bacterium]